MVLVTLLVVSVGMIQAADVTVGCEGAGKGPFKYSSISDALTALHAISYRDHTITVSGTCTEWVEIRDFENLRLIGTAGTAIVADTPRSVLSVNASKSISVEGFVLRGYGRRVNLVSISDSTVVFNDCTIENGNHGVIIGALSDVRFVSSVIQNNGGNGIRVDDNSMLNVEGGSIQGNAVGIRVNRSRATIFGTLIQNNRWRGMNVEQGAALFCCEDMPEGKVLNNGVVGIEVENGGKLEMWGPVLIEGNPHAGIELVASSAKLFGVSQVVQGNGTAGNPLTGGIVAIGNSHVELQTTQVLNNSGSGLVLRENSSARIGSFAAITGNGGDGVRVANLSTATLYGPSLSGNAGVDLSCTLNSFVSGDATKVGRMRCSKFEPSTEPPPWGW